MNNIYIDENEILNIEDGLKVRNILIIFCPIINIFLSYSSLQHSNFYHLSFHEFTWVAIGSFSLLYIILFMTKYSFAEKIPISDIVGLEKVDDYSGTAYFIILKNGKKRKLYKMKSVEEFSELETLIGHLSIKDNI